MTFSGEFPEWLEGTLVRNGPAIFETGEGAASRLNHWFDGFAKLHAFRFGEGKIIYSSRFIESQAYKGFLKTGKLASQEFASSPARGLGQRLMALFNPDFTDNTNVSVVRMAGLCLALTETTSINEFRPDDLSTVGPFAYEDSLKGQITTAHPHLDPSTGAVFNLLTDVSRESTYKFFSLAPGSRKRELVASVKVPRPAYVHSFAMTQRYLILMECPLFLNALELLFSGKPYIDNYHWEKSGIIRFLVVDKNERACIATIEAPSGFCFHHVNAFEDTGGKIIIDAAIYDDSSIVDDLRLDNLLASGSRVSKARLARYSLDLRGSAKLEEVPVPDCNIELPQINYSKHNGLPYRYLYACSVSEEGTFLDSLLKVDLENGTITAWRESECYPGEPVFARRPGAEAEDDGVLLSVVLDSGAGCSFLLALDARTLQEIARARVPDTIPFGFHGQLFAR
ncbi:MAG: carotenoid oxygenase family protein [Cyanobacteria bacterium HKST-UBA02]|nr:carotenoid oxygenase family protein [Cyanobacteria bacterium HKST-UBA02]